MRPAQSAALARQQGGSGQAAGCSRVQQGTAAALPGKAASPVRRLSSRAQGERRPWLKRVGSPSDGWAPPHGLPAHGLQQLGHRDGRAQRWRSGDERANPYPKSLSGRRPPLSREWRRSPNSNPNPNPNPNPNLSTALWARASRQQGAELRVRPRHLPDRPVVPAIAEAWRGQPRAASTGLRRTPRRPCLRVLTRSARTWHTRHMLGSRTPSGPPPACARRPP